jgi:hypothetical protein
LSGAASPWFVPVAIAVGTVVVVPTLVFLGKHWLSMWRAWRHARMSKVFITRTEVEVQFAKLAETQAAQYAQNQALLDTIRAEGQQREGRLLGTLESFHAQNREEAKEQRGKIETVSGRVHDVLLLLGDRRGRG